MFGLDFSTGDVAYLTDNTTRTVQLWLSEKNPVPFVVEVLLDAMCEGLITPEWVARKVKPKSE